MGKNCKKCFDNWRWKYRFAISKMLEENFEDVRVKIIEINKQRAEEIANELSSSIELMVMH